MAQYRKGAVGIMLGLLRRLLRRRYLNAIVILTVAMWASYSAVLRSMGSCVVVDQSPPSWGYLWVADAKACYDEAARLYREAPACRILLIEKRPTRVVAIGAVPSPETIARRSLSARGVPPEHMLVIPGETWGTWSAARVLKRWMRECPEAKVLMLCDRFRSRQSRYVLDEVLDTKDAARVWIRAVPDPRYSEADWWKTRRGWKELAGALLGLVTVRWIGEEPPPNPSWDPTDYETHLRERYGETP